MSNCSEMFPYTSNYYPEIRDEAAVIALTVIVIFLFILTVLNYAEELWFLCRIYCHGPNRKYVVFSLSLFPIISLCCVLGLFIPRSSLIMELVASTLRAISLWVILKIVIGYFGDESKLLAETTDMTFTLRTPPCCCCCVCFQGSPLSSKKLTLVKIFCFQYVVSRPLMVFILTLLWTDNRYSETDEMSASNPGTYFQVLSAISLLFALWGVIALVRAVDSRLSQNRIRAKFLSVQLLTIFSVAQKGILSLLASRDVIGCVATRGSMVQAYRYHLALLVLETFFLSLLARYAFRFNDPPLSEEDTRKEKTEMDHDNKTFKMTET